MRKFYMFLATLLLIGSMCFAQKGQGQLSSQPFPKKGIVAAQNNTRAVTGTLQLSGTEVYTGIGTGGAGTFAAAARFEASALTSYVGQYITRISVCIADASTVTAGKVAILTGTTDAPVVATEQTCTFVTGLNEVILTVPYQIPASTAIMVAYEVTVTSGYPLGADEGPVVEGANLINMGGLTEAFEPLSDLSATLTYNFIISATVEDEISSDPILSVAPEQMVFIGYVGEAATASQQVNVTALNLTGNINITTAAPFEVSANNATFGTTATLTEGGNFYVRYIPGNTELVTPVTGSVTVSSTGVDSQTITLYAMTYDCTGVISDYPYEEGFESGIPCWTYFSNDPANDDRFGLNRITETDYIFMFSSFNRADDYNQYLITPELLFSGSATLSFNYVGTSADSGGEKFAVLASSTTNDISSFTNVSGEIVATNVLDEEVEGYGFETYTITIPAGTKYIAINYYSEFEYMLIIDNFRIEATAPTTYTITAVANNAAYGTVTGGGTYAEGATARLTATANAGYRFVQWNDGNTVNPRDVVVTGNADYTAIFEEEPSVPTYTITAIANNNEYGTVTGGGVYEAGEEVILEAIANTGYVFTGWNDGNTQNPRTITVTGDAQYIATFENENNVTMYTITVNTDQPTMGTVTGGGRYVEGSTAIIEATPNAGYRFVRWNDGNTDNPRNVVVTADATYTATFENIPQYTITASAGAGGAINPMGAVTVYEGDDKDFTITADPGYYITSVKIDGNESYSLLQNTTDTLTYRIAGVYTFVNILGPHTISAEFTEIPTFTITVNTDQPTWGTVAGSGTYYKGASVQISATPNNNSYVFSKWNDDDRHNPRTVVVNADATYTATFVETATVQTYNINVLANNNAYGTVAGGGRYAEGTIVTISATANNGYQFTEWNDHNTDNPREIVVTADATYTAVFSVAGAVEEMVVTEIDIYPNPASDVLNITSSENISRIEIISSTGRIIAQQDVNSDYATFNVSDLSNGMYFVRIFSTEQNSVFVRKFIKD